MTPEEIVGELCDDGECPFCGWSLESKQIFPDCDDCEIYCPNCDYVQGIE